MGEAQTILDMIEAVDPEDTARLDEIDARAECWLKGWHYHGMDGDVYHYSAPGIMSFMPLFQKANPYTRSRDALKSIRPEGWVLSETHQYEARPGNPLARLSGWNVVLFKGDYMLENTGLLPTEELAELHAIIQAISHDRTPGAPNEQ